VQYTKKMLDRLHKQMPPEVLEECTALMKPLLSIKVNRSYLSEGGRFAQGIVTYTNKNKRTVADALVRCDAVAGFDEKVGTQKVPVTGPIPSQVERTRDFMIPLAGRDFSHLECVVTLER
jgi:hypothetical protein